MSVRLDSATEETRYDASPLARAERTPQGGYRVNAALTRAGIFTYPGPDGRPFREYRPPEEVFHADSLATYRSAPVTLLHPTDTPDGLVTPQTFRAQTRGHSEEVKQDGDKVVASLVIQDAEAIGAIDSQGVREISCGYRCRLDHTPGTTPDGQAYDAIQRNIRINHIALVPVGRAGSSVALRFDSAGKQIAGGAPEITRESKAMDTIRIDGVDYPLGTDAERKAALAAFARYQSSVKATQDKLSTETARADAAEAKVAKLEGQVKDLENPARLDAAVTARVTLHKNAVDILGKDALSKDGVARTDAELRRDIIGKAFPNVKLDGKDEVYLSAMYDAAISQPRTDAVTKANGEVANALGAKQPEVTKTDAAAKPEVKAPHLRPLAYSKDAR